MSGPQFTGNSMGIVSSSAILSVGQIMFGGSVGVGNQSVVTINIAGTPHVFTETGIAGDTLYTLIARLIAAINAALGSSGITASLANPAAPMLAIAPLRNGNPLPTIGVSVTGSLTASIVSQPLNILDANPVLYGGHVNPLAPPQPGDSVLLEQQVGPDFDHPDQPTIAYGWRMTRIVDPHLATVRGAVDVGTAAPRPENGYVLPVYSYSRGMFLFDALGAMPSGADLGYGKWNVPASGGYFVNGVALPEWLATKVTAFRAHLSADQAGIASNILTKLAFADVAAVSGVPFDVANHQWIPPAGKVQISVSALWNAPVANANFYIFICKNGEPLAGSHIAAVNNTATTNKTEVVDHADGDDAYDCRVLIFGGAAPYTISGQKTYTRFQGVRL